MKDTIIINLFGAPEAGKSSGATYIFSKLKFAGVDAEYVSEFAKDKVWENNFEPLEHQMYVLGKQYYRLVRTVGKVDVVITDSPFFNSVIYNRDDGIEPEFSQLCKKANQKFEAINYVIKRVKKYNPNGRMQTEEESDAMHTTIINLLDEFRIDYEIVDGTQAEYDKIVEEILHVLDVC